MLVLYDGSVLGEGSIARRLLKVYLLGTRDNDGAFSAVVSVPVVTVGGAIINLDNDFSRASVGDRDCRLVGKTDRFLDEWVGGPLATDSDGDCMRRIIAVINTERV